MTRIKIAITKASSQLGSAIVNATCQIINKENVIALAQTPDRAFHLGVDIRKEDYNNRTELYNLRNDLSESVDVSQEHANIVSTHQQILNIAHKSLPWTDNIRLFFARKLKLVLKALKF